MPESEVRLNTSGGSSTSLPGRVPTQGGMRAAWLGAMGFGAVSVVVYATVAWAGSWLYRTLTEPGAYLFWGVLYLAGAPWILGRLLVKPGLRLRYGVAFVLGFVAYAVVWSAVYFTFRGKPGEVLGTVLGPPFLALAMGIAFRHWRRLPLILAVLVVGHGLGYFAGDLVNSTLRGPAGMVLWGVAHGLGYGAAIGWATRVWVSVGDWTADVRRVGG